MPVLEHVQVREARSRRDERLGSKGRERAVGFRRGEARSERAIGIGCECETRGTRGEWNATRVFSQRQRADLAFAALTLVTHVGRVGGVMAATEMCPAAGAGDGVHPVVGKRIG